MKRMLKFIPVVFLILFAFHSYAKTKTIDPETARKIAVDAYIYGYSLITTEVTRVQMSNVSEVSQAQAPMGKFINIKKYPPGDYRGVSAPNADTLYSLAWVDLEKEPVVFSHPDMGDRYFLFPMYSLWMPVIDSVGTRTGATGATNYLLTREGWQGEVPAGMTKIESPTRYMVILGRTYSTGTEQDYAAVNELQSKYSLVPLSSFGQDFEFVAPPVNPDPGFSMTDKPQQVIDDMGVEKYFNMMARLMKSDAPPAAGDTEILAEMAKIGLVPGEEFKLANLPTDVQQALSDVNKEAMAQILAAREGTQFLKNGWLIPGAAGTYQTYLQRALVAAFGWPANLPEDAVYPNAAVDSEGQTLNGKNNYTITFPKGQTPPAKGFWSITMYIIDGGWWFYPNELNKFTVSTRDDLKYNEDGSLTLYFQHENPGPDKEANWLPAPSADFILMMRLYWPQTEAPSILPPGQGTWAPPAVVKQK